MRYRVHVCTRVHVCVHKGVGDGVGDAVGERVGLGVAAEAQGQIEPCSCAHICELCVLDTYWVLFRSVALCAFCV